MSLYLGLDGGGTGCRAVVADEFAVLGRGAGGAANSRAVGIVAAWKNIDRAVDAALTDAGLGGDAKPLLRACFGLAGVGRPGDRERFLKRSHPFASLRLETDVHVALVGALGGRVGGEVGAVLAAGTGSMVYGQDGNGGRYRVGGWGFPVGDEGGGAWLGLELARAALHTADGRGEASELSETVLSRHGGPEGLLHALHNAGPGDFAELAPLVFAASMDDPLRARLLETAAGQLVALVRAFDCRFPPGEVAFSAVGSVARRLLPDVLERIPARFRAGYREAAASPEMGALRLAGWRGE